MWCEGPAWNGQGQYLIWSDIPNNRMLRYVEREAAAANPGAICAMARTVLEEWRLAHAMRDFATWLAGGALDEGAQVDGRDVEPELAGDHARDVEQVFDELRLGAGVALAGLERASGLSLRAQEADIRTMVKNARNATTPSTW